MEADHKWYKQFIAKMHDTGYLHVSQRAITLEYALLTRQGPICPTDPKAPYYAFIRSEVHD